MFRLRALVLGGAIKASGTGIFEVENPLAPLAPVPRAANASAIFLRYLWRMFVPLRLSSDESGWSIRVLTPRDALFWAAPVLVAALVAVALLRFRDRSAAALGFLFLCVSSLPTANLLFPTGTIFAERLAYLPSGGFCLMAASWIVGRAPRTSSNLARGWNGTPTGGTTRPGRSPWPAPRPRRRRSATGSPGACSSTRKPTSP